MDKNSVLDCYLYYMWNAWDCYENDKVFGENASKATPDPETGQMTVGGTWNVENHLWNKWCRLNDEYGVGAPAAFYCQLSSHYRETIVTAAVNYYNKQ